MERDFMGLNSKESSPMVKEEGKEGSKDSGPSASMRGSGTQWPFSNKVSALPQFMTFKTVQEDRSKKIVFDPLASSAFMPSMSTADAFDVNHKPAAGIVQKNYNLDKQGNSHYAMTAYAVQHDAHAAHRPHEVRPFSVSNQTISVAMSNPFFKTHIGAMGQNLTATTMKQQPLGGIPVSTPHSILPTSGSMAGAVDLRNISKPSGAPAQLTIFYAGAVNVYDDVSPEKAQAIMLLAGNGASTTNQRAQVQASTPKPIAGEGVHGNKSHSTSPCSAISSPISVTSHSVAQSGSGSSNNDEVMATKPIGNLMAPSSQAEPPKMVTSVGSPAATLMPAAVPQARKASLARFLEKRKERMMSTAPYNLSNKSMDGTTSPGSSGISLAGNSGGGSVPFPVSKEQSWCLGPTKNDGSNAKLHTTVEM